MAIVVVGGDSKDIGKTALVCGIISALREFAWTAVKISGHDYEPAAPMTGANDFSARTIHEEASAGSGTDTARYLSAGARRALLVTRFGSEVPFQEIQSALGSDRNIIFESNRIVDVLKPDVCLALRGRSGETKPSFSRLLELADALVTLDRSGVSPTSPARIPLFRLQSLDRISPEMIGWLRGRLKAISQLSRL